MTGTLLLTLAGTLVWAAVVWRAVRAGADLVMLAFVLVIGALVGAGVLAELGIEHPGAWAFLLAGVALMLLWPRKT